MYGAAHTHAGKDVYVLPDHDAAGTLWHCIWDIGGIDTIANHSAKGCTIDLRAATLADRAGGGGYVSGVDGVHGGYTIANGAQIENATGGASNDVLIGNAGNNRLEGGRGHDILAGYGGADTFVFNTTASSGDRILDFQKGQDHIAVHDVGNWHIHGHDIVLDNGVTLVTAQCALHTGDVVVF